MRNKGENMGQVKNWLFDEVEALFIKPFSELIYKAQTVHKENFNLNEMQVSSLLSVKTGECSENCAYCPQSAYYNTGLNEQSFLTLDEVTTAAKKAKAMGVTRFCISASGKSPKKHDLSKYVEMIRAVKNIGLSVCATLGMLDQESVKILEEAGLDFYNHNIDTSAEFYKNIITTHDYADRLKTLSHVAQSSINVCCGVIVGMGEGLTDRINMLIALASLPKNPNVIPINRLIKIKGTPLEKTDHIDNFDFIKMIAVTRIMFPKSIIALAGGRNEMSEEMQALCFLAGANAIHVGEKLLVTPLPSIDKDSKLLHKLGLYSKEIM